MTVGSLTKAHFIFHHGQNPTEANTALLLKFAFRLDACSLIPIDFHHTRIIIPANCDTELRTTTCIGIMQALRPL